MARNLPVVLTVDSYQLYFGDTTYFVLIVNTGYRLVAVVSNTDHHHNPLSLSFQLSRTYDNA